MTNKVKFPLVLCAVCIGAALALAASYRFCAPRIARQEEKKRNEALEAVLPPGAGKTRELGRLEAGPPVFARADADGRILAYATTAKGRGYGSVIEVMVGVYPDYRISGIKVVSHQETPGLGAKVSEVQTDETLWTVLFGGKREKDVTAAQPWFTEQFQGKTEALLEVVKNVKPSETDRIAAISGATITSNAVKDIVKQGIEYVRAYRQAHPKRDH